MTGPEHYLHAESLLRQAATLRDRCGPLHAALVSEARTHALLALAAAVATTSVAQWHNVLRPIGGGPDAHAR